MKNKVFALLLFLIAIPGVSQTKTDSLAGEVTIDEIIVIGNFRTRKNIITRELSINKGDTYKKTDLDSIFVWNHNRIYNTNLFNVVELSLLDSLSSSSDLLITVEERWYLYPAPIFRLIDRNFNEWWVDRDRDINRVNVGIKLDQFNLTGRNDLLRIVAQTGFTNIYTLNYRLPYIEKTQRHGLEIFAGYSDAKNLAYSSTDNNQEFLQRSDSVLRRELGLSLTHTYRSGFYSFHETTIGFSNATISDTIQALNPSYFGNQNTGQRYFQLGYVYKWDKRNNRNYPTNGEYLRGSITKFGLGVYDDLDYWVIRALGSKYVDLGKKFYYQAFFSAAYTINADQPGYYNYTGLGLIQNVLRGYDLFVVEGGSFAIIRNDIKHRIFKTAINTSRLKIRQLKELPFTGYLKLFYDQGYVKSYPNYAGSDVLADEYIYSYGVGLDLVVVNDGVLRFEYARNALNQTTFAVNVLALF